MNQLKRALIFSLLFLMVLVAVPVVASAAQDSQTTIYAISIDGEITPAMSAFLILVGAIRWGSALGNISMRLALKA